MVYLSSFFTLCMLVFYFLFLKTNIKRYNDLYDLFFILYTVATYYINKRYLLANLTLPSFIAVSFIVLASIVFLTLTLKTLSSAPKDYYFIISILEFVFILFTTLFYLQALVLSF